MDLVIFCDVMRNILRVERPEEYLNYRLKKPGVPEEIYNGKKGEKMLAVSQILAESYYLQGVEEEKAKIEKMMKAKIAESMAEGKIEGKTSIAAALVKEGVCKSTIIKIFASSGMSKADAEKLYDQLAAKEK